MEVDSHYYLALLDAMEKKRLSPSVMTGCLRGEMRGVMPDDQQDSLFDINNIYIIVKRRFFLI